MLMLLFFLLKVVPTVLPAILAPLAESDTALATACCAFVRSFGLMVRIHISHSAH